MTHYVPSSTFPGKFEGCGPLGEQLHDLSLDGCDDEFLSEDEQKWFGLLLNTGIYGANHAILSEDSQGFVEYGTYDTEKKARADWERLALGQPAWYDDNPAAGGGYAGYEAENE